MLRVSLLLFLTFVLDTQITSGTQIPVGRLFPLSRSRPRGFIDAASKPTEPFQRKSWSEDVLTLLKGLPKFSDVTWKINKHLAKDANIFTGRKKPSSSQSKFKSSLSRPKQGLHDNRIDHNTHLISHVVYPDETRRPEEAWISNKVIGMATKVQNANRHFGAIQESEDKVAKRGPIVGNQLPEVQSVTNSPIVYIRMPPAPYEFHPSSGFTSRLHLPAFLGPKIKFVNNGRPTTIYQLLPDDRPPEAFTTTAPPPSSSTTTPNLGGGYTDSPVTWLKERYTFNGDPNSLFIFDASDRRTKLELLHSLLSPRGNENKI